MPSSAIPVSEGCNRFSNASSWGLDLVRPVFAAVMVSSSTKKETIAKESKTLLSRGDHDNVDRGEISSFKKTRRKTSKIGA
jgi:hypothetical protein